ncbi:MAG: outer membrane protein assembly factor BamD [Pseudomonadota bacterium]
MKTTKHKMAGLLVLGLALLLMNGCSWFKELEVDKSPEELAEEGAAHLDARRYSLAAETYQKLKDRYPYSNLAVMAELKIADAHYQNEAYIEAQAAYAEFQKLHPSNEAAPYTAYQEGMCYFMRMTGFDRDQGPAEKAIETFARLQQTYPESKYAGMALSRMTEAQESIAHHEFYVGEFYYKNGEYQAALGRFLGLLKNYADTGYHAEAINYIRNCREKIAEAELLAKQQAKPGEAPAEVPPDPLKNTSPGAEGPPAPF